MRLWVLLRSVKLSAIGNNQNISFLPPTRMHGEFLRLPFLQAHRETGALHCRWYVIATQPIGLVPVSSTRHSTIR